MDTLARPCGPAAMADAPPAPASTSVVFGAAGHLTRRSLMPPPCNLHRAGLLDEGFQAHDIAGVQPYAAGTHGPAAADAPLERDGRHRPRPSG